MPTKTTDTFWKRFFKGVVIALGFILPGVSGGVLAAILGIYERLLGFMAHFRRNFKRDFWYFVPVGLGGIVGIALLSAPLEYLLAHAQVIVLWGFAGAIIGTLPALMKTATSRAPRDWLDGVWFFGTFIISAGLLYFMSELFGTLPANFGGFIVAGALITLGVLVPGLSPSNLLLILGLFTPMLTGFKRLDIVGVYLPIAIGGILAMALFSKLMDHLLVKFHSRVYHFILGIVLASTMLLLIPNPYAAESISYAHATLSTYLFSAIALAVGIALGYWMSALESKYK
ncbi:integral membrane protein [Lactiplantibacillus plantarum]|nr:integral membrane protein [Lactiplantibacillus plantarum]MCG0865795.1 integral membrane protein [Lactiplantibacillus plantarum]